MIKCNVTVCGTISRQAQMRANKEGKQFISFGISVVIPAKSGINQTVEISVAKDGNNQAELVNYPVGSRVEVAGVLQFHKKGEVLYLNLSASGVNSFNAGNQDAITGSIEFRGTIGKQVEVKTDKKGKPYTMFSAYSSEKDGENYSYTWVRFMQFDAQKADWVQAKAGINAKGDLQVGAYNDRLDLTCRITELTPWEKKKTSTN
ncbi:hypothetical protein HPS57_13415 [Prevotella sp. PINT]|jgi:hypothetical protein|uniref:hypothetical protein n=1 Tax=Palleniella intestinalis TaxID=2736291 RepID=UPI0015579B04|nr:hypothetical protein [Palleniella intestinalis]NPD82965.1 hypothetical protein [Palleniella intestinalis]